ncbi:PadR family transcriptional regulator [Nonomuraea wenchangensis]|uniref:PadR family transcriptional regulator n=1 Tax=Nonomuraea wenchangensis TaxID=568860 RepID=UPI003319B2B8
MAALKRITQPTLDVLEALVKAFDDDEPIHGWVIMRTTGRAGPTVYKVLDRLEDARWIEGEWEQLADDQPGPRRRFYRLTGQGVAAARALLLQRRPAPRPALNTTPLRELRGDTP